MQGERPHERTELTARLRRVCRTVVGDRLRRVTVVENGDRTVAYRRGDLSESVDEAVHGRAARGGADRVRADGGYAVRPVEDGYLARVQAGTTTVVLTAGGTRLERGQELAAAVTGLIGD